MSLNQVLGACGVSRGLGQSRCGSSSSRPRGKVCASCSLAITSRVILATVWVKPCSSVLQ